MGPQYLLFYEIHIFLVGREPSMEKSVLDKDSQFGSNVT